MYDTASELYNYLLEFYFDEYNDLAVAKLKNRRHFTYDPTNLFLETYTYDNWFEKEGELTDKEESVDLSDMPSHAKVMRKK